VVTIFSSRDCLITTGGAVGFASSGFLRRRQQQEPPRPGSQQLPHLSNDCSLPLSVSLPALLPGIVAIETSFAFDRVKDRTMLPPLSHFPLYS
jgi:hypothetical protein